MGVIPKRKCKESYTRLLPEALQLKQSEKLKLKDDRFEEEYHQKVVAFLYLKSVKTSRSGKIQTPASGFHFSTLHAINLKSQLHPPYPLQSPNTDIQAWCSSFLFNRKVNASKVQASRPFQTDRIALFCCLCLDTNHIVPKTEDA